MSKKRPRQLRSDEEALWRKVAGTTRPLKPEKPKFTLRDSAVVERKPAQPSEQFEYHPPEFTIGSKVNYRNSSGGYRQADRPATSMPLKMDRNVFNRMKRGKSRPEARIDLHGMTADAALAELVSFLFRAQNAGKRLVLVITGKGRIGPDEGPIPTRGGVLRQSLPAWVARPPLNAIVQQIAEAHPRHGGSGAFYVYLRRGG